MNNLIASNLAHHPGRTVATISGVAISVILVVLTVGLTRGMLRDRGARETNTGVEILLSSHSQHGISLTSQPLTLPVEWAGQVITVPGVTGVTPVGQHLEMKGESGIGLRQIDGVEFDRYSAITKIRIVEGSPLPAAGDAVVVDVKYAAARKTKIGDRINLLDRDFTVAGIYEPETGARIMIPLQTMQELLGAAGKCSMLMVKCANPSEQEEVARRIVERFPDFRVVFTRDLPRLFAEGYGSFNLFLDAVTGLAAIISLLVISLTMYTTVTERTRQIGILKSLGASKGLIVLIFIKESLLISVLGIIIGLAAAILTRALLVNWTQTRMEVELDYVIYAAATALGSGLIGALYPALRAAAQDPVEALSYE